MQPTAPILLVFDFDGVIADSSAAVRVAIDRLAVRKGVRSPADAEIRSFTTPQLMRQMRIAWWELPWRAWQAKQIVLAHAGQIRLCPEILAVLRWAKQHGVPLAVASSNSTPVIARFLAQHLAESRFAPILGNLPMFGKQRALRRLGRRHTLIYVGDEVRDVEAARRCGIASIAVTWGKDSAATLQAAGATRLAQSGEALAQHCAALCAQLNQPPELA